MAIEKSFAKELSHNHVCSGLYTASKYRSVWFSAVLVSVCKYCNAGSKSSKVLKFAFPRALVIHVSLTTYFQEYAHLFIYLFLLMHKYMASASHRSVKVAKLRKWLRSFTVEIACTFLWRYIVLPVRCALIEQAIQYILPFILRVYRCQSYRREPVPSSGVLLAHAPVPTKRRAKPWARAGSLDSDAR